MLMLKDTVVQDILQFLECCEGIAIQTRHCICYDMLGIMTCVCLTCIHAYMLRIVGMVCFADKY